ncbi:MAG TPA: cytochrome b/b6 domain-containing protein [Burkholderiaceae bacterium]|nr:cytochrome b/b6 domain-containing protein [Burkholderiaceae bacterium]
MRALLERIGNLLHGLIALACVWLAASSPWLALYYRLPESPGAIDLSHVVIGLALLPITLLYFAACTLGGRWRLYFPWLAGQGGSVLTDIAGIFGGIRPGSEGGGLFAAIEGLLLLTLLVACVSGAFWFALQGSDAAVVARSAHRAVAHALIALLLAHVAAVALHLVDLVRD